MNGHSTNQDNNDDGNLFGMRKISYWEIYGVKRFPYRGRRKFTPLLYQSFDGGMKISNDVFGLTIRQFERMYKSCLKRRKTHEQWILNLRYPDKSSNDYLDYLQNCTDSTKDHLHLLGKDTREKYLYEHLVNTIGTEIDIRTRQRLFITSDITTNACSSYAERISSGSLAEGLDLPGSDINIMYVEKNLNVIQNVRKIKRPLLCTTFVMETDSDHPGFTRLKVVTEKKHKKGVCVSYESNFFYASWDGFVDRHKSLIANSNMSLTLHGPCLSDSHQSFDAAFCLRSIYFLHNAISWASRQRRQWPTNIVIDKIIDYRCLIVPIGPKNRSNDNSLWRLSFFVMEITRFNISQGADFKLFAVMAALSLKISSLECTPEMKKIGYQEHSDQDYDNSQNVHSTLNLFERMKISIARHVTYMKYSSLLPEELQLEAKYPCFQVPPVVLSQCLRFLSYHHLGHISNRQQALRNLCQTVNNKYIMDYSVGYSESSTIVGVCFEISGDKNAAYHWYDFAMRCRYNVCPTAKIRKSKLFEI